MLHVNNKAFGGDNILPGRYSTKRNNDGLPITLAII